MKGIKNGCVEIDDTDMYYVSFGTGEKNLVALPGLSDGLTTVKGKAIALMPAYKKFLKEFTVYIFSRKNVIPDGYTIEQMADDQVKVMKSLGINKACVLGVSQGGMIAQYIAIKYPEIVDKLILAVTAPYANATVVDAVSYWIEMAQKEDHFSLMLDTAKRMYSKKFLDKYEKYMSLFSKLTKPNDYDRFLKNANAILKFDVRDRLIEIESKTLIIAGSDDKTIGNDAPSELTEGIKGSELYIYDGLGHGAFEEADDFYDRVYKFCCDS